MHEARLDDARRELVARGAPRAVRDVAVRERAAPDEFGHVRGDTERVRVKIRFVAPARSVATTRVSRGARRDDARGRGVNGVRALWWVADEAATARARLTTRSASCASDTRAAFTFVDHMFCPDGLELSLFVQ